MDPTSICADALSVAQASLCNASCIYPSQFVSLYQIHSCVFCGKFYLDAFIYFRWTLLIRNEGRRERQKNTNDIKEWSHVAVHGWPLKPSNTRRVYYVASQTQPGFLCMSWFDKPSTPVRANEHHNGGYQLAFLTLVFFIMLCARSHKIGVW